MAEKVDDVAAKMEEVKRMIQAVITEEVCGEANVCWG